MTSSTPMPPNRNRLSRRMFVGAVAGLGVATIAGTALAGTASAAPKLTRAVGAAKLGDTVHVLGRAGRRWVVVNPASGASQATSGLERAELFDLSTTGNRLVAVGAQGNTPAIWESADGQSWQRSALFEDLDGHLTAVDGTMAVGALLTLERVPWQRLVVQKNSQKTGQKWTATQTAGLESTNELTATALGRDNGWTLSTVDANGATLHRSTDGLVWTTKEQHVDTAVKAFDGGKWVANSMSGTSDHSRRAPSAQAVGIIGNQSYWLVAGTLVTATV